MKRTFLVIILLILFNSCKAQQDSKPILQWRTFVFEEPGIKVDFPCEPEKKIKIWQEDPIIRHYNFSCKSHDINFNIGVKEDLDEYSDEEIEQSLGSTERSLQEASGKKIKFISGEDIIRDGHRARYFDAELFENGRWRQITVVTGRTRYEAMIVAKLKFGGSLKELGNSTDDIAKRFIESFHLIQKAK